MERQVYCITHSDLDGMAAAAVVRERYPHCTVMITNYGKQRMIWKFKPGDLIFITDFTLTLDEYQRLAQKNCEIIWIDHHRRNYEELYTQGWQCPGLRRDDFCGAALTWMYFHPSMPPEAMPDVLKLVNDYDLWLFKDNRTKDFTYGVGLWDTRPGIKAGDEFWRDMFSNDPTRMNQVLKFGGLIRQYVESSQDTLCKDLAYYTSINTPEGEKRVLAMAVRAGNSSIFDRMDKSEVDAVFTGQYVSNIGRYRCSMYSPDNEKEILNIVTMFPGGGGHPKAAGFSTEAYPLKYPYLKPPVPIEEVIGWYEELNTLKHKASILKQWVDRAASITARVLSFHTTFCNYPTQAFNHYYLPELLNVSSTSTDCINPATSTPSKLMLGFVLTNTGWFRTCIFPSDTEVDMAAVKEDLIKTFGDNIKNLTEKNGGLWWYSRECPVTPTILPVGQYNNNRQ